MSVVLKNEKTLKPVELPLALMRVGLKGMNGAFYGPRGYREITEENININEFSKLSLIIPSYFPMMQKEYDYNQSAIKMEHIESYPDIKNKPYHVRYVGIADMDMDIMSVKNALKPLFSDDDAPATYTYVGDIKKRWVNWLTSQTRLTIGNMREKSGVFDEVCKDTLAIALAAQAKGFDPIVFFSGCKGFRVLWSDPAAFYWVDETYDYGKAFVSSEAFYYFETHLEIDPMSNIVKKLDASVYSRDKGIKPDLDKHPSSHLYPVLIQDLDQFNDTLLYDTALIDNTKVLDQRLVDRICNYWLDLPKLCPALVPVINPIFDYNQSTLELEPYSTNGKEYTKPVYEHKEYSSEQLKEIRAGQILDPMYEQALLRYVNDHSTKQYTSLNGITKKKGVIGDPLESKIWLISLTEFTWCGLKPGFHSDGTDIRFIINTKNETINQKCFSTCAPDKSFPVWASSQGQALSEERKQQWREAQKKASNKSKKQAEKQKDQARKQYATGQTTINNSIPEQYKEMKKMVDDVKIIKTIPSVNRVLVRSSDPEPNKPVRSFSSSNLPNPWIEPITGDLDAALMKIDTSSLTGTQSLPVFNREDELTQTIKQTIERLKIQNPEFNNSILYPELEKVLTIEFIEKNKKIIHKIVKEICTEMANATTATTTTTNNNNNNITYPDVKLRPVYSIASQHQADSEHISSKPVLKLMKKAAADIRDHANSIKYGNSSCLNPEDSQAYNVYINQVGFWFSDALSSITQNRKKRGRYINQLRESVEFAINDVIKKQEELMEEGKKWIDLGVKTGMETELDGYNKSKQLRSEIKKGLRDVPIKKKPLEPFMDNKTKYNSHKKYVTMIHRARLFDEGARLEAKEYYADQFNVLTYKNVEDNLNIKPIVISLNANESILDKALCFDELRIDENWDDLMKKYLFYIVAFEPEDNLAQEWGYIKATDLIIDPASPEEKRKLIVKREFIKTGPPLKRLLTIQSKMMLHTSKNRPSDPDKIKAFLYESYLKGIGSDNLHNLVDVSFDNDPLYDRISKLDIDPKFIAALKSAGHEIPKPDFKESTSSNSSIYNNVKDMVDNIKMLPCSDQESKAEAEPIGEDNDNTYDPSNEDLDALDAMEDETTRAVSNSSSSMEGQTDFNEFNSKISNNNNNNNNNTKGRKRLFKKIDNDDGEAEYTGA